MCQIIIITDWLNCFLFFLFFSVAVFCVCKRKQVRGVCVCVYVCLYDSLWSFTYLLARLLCYVIDWFPLYSSYSSSVLCMRVNRVHVCVCKRGFTWLGLYSCICLFEYSPFSCVRAKRKRLSNVTRTRAYIYILFDTSYSFLLKLLVLFYYSTHLFFVSTHFYSFHFFLLSPFHFFLYHPNPKSNAKSMPSTESWNGCRSGGTVWSRGELWYGDHLWRRQCL